MAAKNTGVAHHQSTTNDRTFPTDYASVLARIEGINPRRYAKTRNFLDGAVSRLSPYLTHGVISTRDVLTKVLKTKRFRESEKLIFELGWRDFFQTVYRYHQDNIFRDLRQPQDDVTTRDLAQNIKNAHTGIHVIDQSINELESTGYMHNHARMWVASLATNIARAHWSAGAAWMYYHLLDGDLASNTLSWQWVAGSFSSKKYFANQQNINKYSASQQHGTCLDVGYEDFPLRTIPEVLQPTEKLELEIVYPSANFEAFSNNTNADKPVLLYHLWMLDPVWQQNTDAQRILLIEPSELERHPMSQKRIDFVVELSKNIPNLQICVANFNDFVQQAGTRQLISREHPAIHHWQGTTLHKDANPTMFTPRFKAYNSFMSYWKACQKTTEYKNLGQ